MNLEDTNSIPTEYQAHEGYQSDRILTLTAVSRASSHESSVNFSFTHSLKSGVVFEGWSLLRAGVERHCRKKPVVKLGMHGGRKRGT